MIVETTEMIRFAADSIKGSRYERNEDSFLALPEWGVFAVADGMGGHNGGAVASNMLVNYVLEEIQQVNDSSGELPDWRNSQWMVETIECGNRKVFDASKEDSALEGMGTTLSLLLLLDEEALCFHVGDSRIYEHHNFLTKRLTRDHAEGAEDLGQRGNQHSGVRGIQRAIGIRPSVAIDVSRFPRQEDAEYLIVSDGVSDMLPDFEISNVLSNLEFSYRQRIDVLLSSAVERGGSDDKTAILIG